MEVTVSPRHVRTSPISIFIAFLNISRQPDVVCITIFLKHIIFDREKNRQSSTSSNVGLVPWGHAEPDYYANNVPLLLKCSVQWDQSKNATKLIFWVWLSLLATSQNSFWCDCFTAWKLMEIFVQDIPTRRRGHHHSRATTTPSHHTYTKQPREISSNGMFMFQQGLVYLHV